MRTLWQGLIVGAVFFVLLVIIIISARRDTIKMGKKKWK